MIHPNRYIKANREAFERDVPGGLTDFGDALWWTAMIMTTMGSAYWPVTPEGRALCVILALYAFAMFGYVTAVLATYFVGRDAEADDAEVAGATALRRDVQALRADLEPLIWWHETQDQVASRAQRQDEPKDSGPP